MKNTFRTILIALIILIIVGGLALFLFRHSVADSLRQQIEVIPTLAADQIKIAPTEALDVEVLKSPRLTALVNQVINFDFNNVCWRPTADQVVTQPGLADNAAATATGTEIAPAPRNTRIIKCVKGNGTLFIIGQKPVK
jgi:hypothetical protein